MNYSKISLFFVSLFIFFSCAHKTLPKLDENPGIINLVRQSYIRGCVDAHHLFKQKKVFFKCKEMSQYYTQEIYEIIK